MHMNIDKLDNPKKRGLSLRPQAGDEFFINKGIYIVVLIKTGLILEKY